MPFAKVALKPVIAGAFLSAAVFAGSPSASLAVGATAGSAAVQKCVPKMQVSGLSFGSTSSDATGLTDYEAMVGYCMEDYYRAYRRLP